jgi:hypothetical protein
MHTDLRSLLAAIRDITGIDLIARPRSAPITERVHSARRVAVHAARRLAASAPGLRTLLAVTRPMYLRIERWPLTPSEEGAVSILVHRFSTVQPRNTFR